MARYAVPAFSGDHDDFDAGRVTAQALKEVGNLIESGHITPVIDRAYPLTEAASAVRLVEERSPAGKVIVTIEPPPPEPPPQ